MQSNESLYKQRITSRNVLEILESVQTQKISIDLSFSFYVKEFNKIS